MTSPIQMPILTLAGQIDKVELLDPGLAPNTVIDVSSPFTVRVDWSVSGSSLPYLGGEWVVRALVESMGQGFEGQIGATSVVPLTGASSYTTDINVPAGALATPAPNTDRVYKLVVLVAHRQFGLKTQIAGFGLGVYFEIQEP
jgi:hypothetical protein